MMTYNTGIKTRVYHHQHQSHQQHKPTHGHYDQHGGSSKDNEYQPSITHHYGNRDSSYQQQHEGSYYQETSSQSQQQSHQQSQHQPIQHHYQEAQQPQSQPNYEQRVNFQQNPTLNWQNSITEYYTGCPPGHTGQLPYAYDCRRFLNCWNGRGHIQTCSVGTVFNPETLECDRPDKVKCEAALGVLGVQTTAKSATHEQSSRQRPSQTIYKAGRFTDKSTDSVEVLCPPGSEGLQPHPSDCTRFINCANGNMHIQQCGPGTAFSIPTKVCDFINKVDCSDREQDEEPAAPRQANEVSCPSDASGLYPHPNNCTQFLQCSNGETFVQDCGPGTAFDRVRLLCDYKEKVKCCSGCALGDTTESVVVVKTKQFHNQESSPRSYHHEDLPHTADILCLNGITGLFPYPFDYTKFINCKNGNTAIQNCVPGTAFSISKGYCESLEQMQQSDHVMYIVSQVSYEYSQTLITCPPGTEGTHLYPFDAAKFVRCVRSQMTIVPCGSSQVFSITRRSCLPKGQVLKHERVRLINELQTTNNYPSTDERYKMENIVHCPHGLVGNYPNPFDSTKYLRCNRGRLYSESCASGEAFSLSHKRCALKEEINANDRVPQAKTAYGQDWKITDMEITHGSIDGLIYLMCPPGLDGYFLHPFDCTKYIHCSRGTTVVDNCLKGAVFSISRKECIPRDKVEAYDRVEYMTTTKNEFSNEAIAQIPHDIDINCSPGTFGIYPHPQDFHKYMRCANGRISVEDCPAGQVFSVSKSLCRNENEVDYNDRSNYGRGHKKTQIHYTESDSTISNTGSYNPQPPLSHTANQDMIPPSGVLHPPPVSSVFPTHTATEISCPPGANGRYPHPYDCTKFLMCSNGQTHVQNCGPGTAWNKAMEVCDIKDNVDCFQTGLSNNNVGASAVLRPPQLPSNSHEYTATEVSCTPGANGRYPHPYDCTKFLMCTNGETHVQACGPGTAWNKVMEVCDFKDNVDCSQTVLNGNSFSGNSFTSTSEYKIICPAGVDGLYQHPFDWNKYLVCDHGQTKIMDCAPGTVFSISRRICATEAEVLNTDRCNNGVRINAYGNTNSRDYNNRDSKAYGNSVVNTQWSYGGIQSQLQPQPQYRTHTNTHATGDRWTNMNLPRPQGATYDQTTSWQQTTNIAQVNPPTKPNVTPVWTGTSEHVDQRNPTHTIIYEEGSFEPNRNYNHQMFTTPLAPLKPSSNSSTSTIVYAQPVGSQENSEEIFSNNPLKPSNSYSPQPLSPFNRQNHTKHINTWIPIRPIDMPKHDLMPSNPNQGTVFTYTSEQVPLNTHLTTSHETSQPSPHNPSDLSPSGSQSARPLTHLKPSYGSGDSGQKTLPDLADLDPGQISHNLDDLDQLPSTSLKHNVHDNSNLYGGLQPSLSNSPPSTTARNFLDPLEQTTQLPPPPKPTNSTRNFFDYPQLSNATIQTFPHQPHYSPQYSEVSYSHNNTLTGRKVPQHSSVKGTNRNVLNDQNANKMTSTPPSYFYGLNMPPHANNKQEKDDSMLDANEKETAMKDALKLLLKPYLDPETNVDDDVAEMAQSHIMNLVLNTDRDPTITTTTTTTHKPLFNKDTFASTSTARQEDVELILAGEQHSLVATTTKTGNQEITTKYNLHQVPLESERSSTKHHHHNSNWHKHHSHHPHHFKFHHSREFHEKHPNIPNPFDDTITPKSPFNPRAESTTPRSFNIDLRFGDDCPFDCGNGKCVDQHQICDGVNNCGNRKDEEQCAHLGYEIRLTGGESSNMGRVEVKILGKWGYVCDDKFGLRDADVVCRELGFKMGAVEVRGNSYYPPTDINLSFAMDEVDCKGNETSLKDCDFKGWGVNNCGPDEVVGVVCKVSKLKCPDNYWLCSKSKECIPTAFLCDVTPDCEDGSDESSQVCNAPIKYRLEGGRSSNEGRLEVFYRGEWGTVCDDDFSLKEAQVVCNSFGLYGKAEIAKNIYGPGSGPIWLDQVSCLGNETKIDECSHWTWGENNCNHTEDVGLKCTAGPKPNPARTSKSFPTHSTNNDNDLESSFELNQSELDDLGLYQGLWQRSSKAVPSQKKCGHFKSDLFDEYEHPEERVVNGSIAKRGRHPWQATIRTRGRGGISSHWCGAVIISKKLILTAAHCLAGYPKGSYFVRMGDHYANIAESSEVDSNIENWYIHEKFRDQKHMNNDIALILLKTPARFNDYIQPICLPEKGASLEPNRMCTISGWGSIKSGTSAPSNILRSAQVPILADEVCNRKNVYANAMTEGMFCAGFLDESADACDGDSGGPLVCSDDDGETLYGIISWGQHCGYANHPGVYVKVEKYIDWIYEKINQMIQQGKL